MDRLTSADIIGAVAAAGGALTVDGDSLRCRARRGALPPEFAVAVRTHKAELIAAVVAAEEARALDRLDGWRAADGAEPEPPSTAAPFAPLDPEIAADEAGKRPRTEIVGRPARLAARAGQPGASDLDRQLAADWRAVLAA